MQIRCRCESCQTRLKVSEKLAGTKVRCPHCKTVLLIPAGPAGQSPHSAGPPPVAASPPPDVTANPVPPASESKPRISAEPPVALPLTAVPMAIPLPAVAAGFAAPSAKAGSSPKGPLQEPDTAAAGPPAPAVPLAQPMAHPGIPQAVAIAEIVPPSETLPVIQLRSRYHGWGNVIFAAMGLSVLTACLLLLATFLFWLATRGPQIGTLVVKIPLEIRDECELVIDDQVREMDAHGRLEFRLPAGQHHVRVNRLGHLPVEKSLQLPAGKESAFTPTWTSAAHVGKDQQTRTSRQKDQQTP